MLLLDGASSPGAPKRHPGLALVRPPPHTRSVPTMSRESPMIARILTLLRRFRGASPEPAGPQYGALPYTILDGQLVVLLITSRGRGKWIFPKGGLVSGMTPSQSAAREAYEEAGVEGDIEDRPIGSYILPVTAERPQPVEVKIYPLRVAHQREDWQERGARYRHWAVLAEARRLITHDGLAELAVALAQRELGSGKAQIEKTVAITQ
jgi:8-oxo-dGTP pyrophosphatase MutT (NUDIX family)